MGRDIPYTRTSDLCCKLTPSEHPMAYGKTFFLRGSRAPVHYAPYCTHATVDAHLWFLAQTFYTWMLSFCLCLALCCTVFTKNWVPQLRWKNVSMRELVVNHYKNLGMLGRTREGLLKESYKIILYIIDPRRRKCVCPSIAHNKS